MSLTDFILSILGNLVANRIDRIADKRAIASNAPPLAAPSKDSGIASSTLPSTIQLTFSSYELSEPIKNLLVSISPANVYIFLEETPSTAYNLGALVLESARTLDWFPFSRPLSFEGTGGGWGNTLTCFKEIENAKLAGADVVVSLRIASNQTLNAFRDGSVTWNDLKLHSIPAMISSDAKIKYIWERYRDELQKQAQRAE